MRKNIIFTKFFFLTTIIIISAFNSFSQVDTAQVRRLMDEGLIKLKNNQVRQAIQLFDQGREMLHKIAVETDARNQDIITSSQLTREAEQQIMRENLTGALDLLNQAIALNNNNIEALKFRGSIRLILEQQIPKPKDRDYIGLINDYTNAVRIIDQRVNATPRNSQERKEFEKEKAKILINRAYVKMQTNRNAAFYSAIEDYTEAIRNDDQNWDGFLGRAVAYNKIKDNRREVNDYLKAFELINRYNFRMSDQEWSDLYLTVAIAYANLRDKRNAYDYASRAFNLGNKEAEKIMERNKV
jgi:tetratricopeptide (TPR) repeat protein